MAEGTVSSARAVLKRAMADPPAAAVRMKVLIKPPTRRSLAGLEYMSGPPILSRTHLSPAKKADRGAQRIQFIGQSFEGCGTTGSFRPGGVGIEIENRHARRVRHLRAEERLFAGRMAGVTA